MNNLDCSDRWSWILRVPQDNPMIGWFAVARWHWSGGFILKPSRPSRSPSWFNICDLVFTFIKVFYYMEKLTMGPLILLLKASIDILKNKKNCLSFLLDPSFDFWVIFSIWYYAPKYKWLHSQWPLKLYNLGFL